MVTMPLLLQAHHQPSRESQLTKVMPARQQQKGEGAEASAQANEGVNVTEVHRYRHGHGGERHHHTPAIVDPRPPFSEPSQAGSDSTEGPAGAWTTASSAPTTQAENSAPLTAAELRTARIQLIKRQILEKLRMSDRPNVTSSEPIKLPGPLEIAGLTRDAPRHRIQLDDNSGDGFYGTIKQVILPGTHSEYNYCS